MTQQDKIYAVPHKRINKFSFNEDVAAVFPDMLKRSVPGYDNIIDMTGVLTKRYIQPGTKAFDLGCSLGAVSLSMLANLEHQDCDIIAVDNSPAMIEGAKKTLHSFQNQHPEIENKVEFICDDIQNIDIQNASVVSLNFTLQFIAPEKRQALINKIFQGLRPGGVLILSEKVHAANTEDENLLFALHHAFKSNNGYSDLEISQKRTALEKVLIADTHQQHFERLKIAGFDQSCEWYKCFNFVSFLALKK